MSRCPKFDRVPPHNVEAERACLGAMLLNPDAVAAGVEILRDRSEEVFYWEPHQVVYSAVVSLFAKNVPVDAVTLMDELQRRGTLDRAGGTSYLAELTGAVPTSANIEVYARIILDTAILRSIITTSTRLASEAYTGETPAGEMLDRAEGEIFRLSAAGHTRRVASMRDLSVEGLGRIEALMKANGHVTGVPSGFSGLDTLTAGFQPSDMVVLAARPSVGKTAFSLNIATHAALHARKGVLVFSLEMDAGALMQRMICSVGQIDVKRLRTGFLARTEFPKAKAAADRLHEAPIFIDDTPGISPLELRSKARMHAARHGLDMVIIDYLQLMRAGRRSETRQTEVAEISREIKGLARELGVPVLALSQLSREAEKDEGGAPKLSHLRESGAIEQDADVVMMLSRPRKGEGPENAISVHLAKQRNGPTGHFNLLFDRDTQRFRNMGGEEPEEPQPAYAARAIPEEIDYTEDDGWETEEIPFG